MLKTALTRIIRWACVARLKFSLKEHSTRRKFSSRSKTLSLLACVLIFSSFAISYARTAPDYKFKVHNNTKHAIKKIFVREEGKSEWGYFDIGSGIAAGETEELVWDKSTDNGGCNWDFKAVFDSGEESESVKFDFCEKNLVLEFD